MSSEALAESAPIPSPLVRNGRRDAQRAASAERMRRFRANRAAGMVHLTFNLSADGVATLVELGWLAAAERHSSLAVHTALIRLVDAALDEGISPKAFG